MIVIVLNYSNEGGDYTSQNSVKDIIQSSLLRQMYLQTAMSNRLKNIKQSRNHSMIGTVSTPLYKKRYEPPMKQVDNDYLP